MAPPDFIVIGGGCYGRYFLSQLTEARQRGKLAWSRVIIVDRNPDCALAASIAGLDDVELAVCAWEDYGAAVFDAGESWRGAHLVPAPIAPHVVRHWLVAELARRRGLRVEPVPYPGPMPQLPYADVTDAGTLVLSHAPGLCPTNCVEPRSCPLTRSARTWDMPDTVSALEEAARLDALEIFTCRHFAYGVGTIPIARVLDAGRRLLELDVGAILGVATVSGCHGLLDAVRLVDAPGVPK